MSRSSAGGIFRSAILFSIFTNLLVLTGPLYMMQIYDRVLGSRSEETLVALTVLMAGLFLLYGLLDAARTRLMARAAARVQDASADRVFRAAIEARAKAPRSEVGATALDDLTAIRTFLGSSAFMAILDMPWTPLFLAAIFIFHPMLGAVAAIGGSVLITAAALNQYTTRNRRREADENADHARRLAQDAATGASLAWAQGMVGALCTRWRVHLSAATRAALTAHDRTSGFTSFSRAFRFFLQSAILALGAWLVLQGSLTAGAMIAASILLGRALAPVEQAISHWPVLQRARLGHQRLGAFLDGHPEAPPQTVLPRPEASISARDVGVATGRGQPPLLSGISFELAPGEALGVIGKSGAGKSTLARVVTGLSLPATGEVRLGGATLAQYDRESLGQHIGYLPQEVHLFEGTVAENIAGMSECPDARAVVDAARQAHVHEIILRLP
ncbi:MAG: ATP-binding cassette domain-containing protein, partial [Pseudomonadota bacterium]